MELQKRLEANLKQALRDRAELVRDTLRMVLADLKNKNFELGRDLTFEEEEAVFQRAVKTRQESVLQFEQGGRADLVARERAEITVIQGYLPKPLSEEETRATLKSLLAELGVTSKKDLGVAMKALMSRHKGRVDGRLAQKILGELLP
jgi:uncharacterized protein YqeY